MCERNTGVTDVPRVGMCTVGVRQFDGSPSTRRWVVEIYAPPGPHQGASVGFGYTCTCIGQETAKLLGCGGRRSAHCRRCGGDRRDPDSVNDCHENISVRRGQGSSLRKTSITSSITLCCLSLTSLLPFLRFLCLSGREVSRV